MSGTTNCYSSDGSLEVKATGNHIPFEYSIDQKGYQTSQIFTGLISGYHLVSARDRNGCIATLNVFVENFSSDLSVNVDVTPDSECFGDNGQVVVNVSGGRLPYQTKFSSSDFDQGMSFSGLSPGFYDIVVKDGDSCLFSLSFKIPRASTGISWKNEIKTIIDTRCAKSGCHAPGSGRVDLSIFENVKEYAVQIKLYTETFRMPRDGVLSSEQIQKIGCWVDDGALSN